MTFLGSLDPRDRRLLLGTIGLAVTFAVIIGFFLPGDNNNENALPSTYLTGQHGARAAYETLLNAGYPIERWERPLAELAANAGPGTVVIFAAPLQSSVDDVKAVHEIVERGGRVLATGFSGGALVPGGSPSAPKQFSFAACKLEPEGLDPLASTGEVWMAPASTWQLGNPGYRVQYTCSGQPAVVEYDYDKGHVVWWASTTPLENGPLARAADLDLLLNSLGPREGHRFYWDESLHGNIRSTWSYADGPALTLLRLGLLGLGVLIIFSFSRRSGPVRALPMPPRAAPVEYLEALGSLYRNAGAASTAVSAAFDRFRRHSLLLCGLRAGPMQAEELAAVLRRRFPRFDAALETDLVAAEEAARDESIEPRSALRIIQALHAHLQHLDEVAHPAALTSEPNAQEKAS
jgi:hypothetical protein